MRTSQLGGRGPYADVVEELTINVLGASGAACYANLDTLSRLLDKADRWWRRNEPIAPVLLKYAPQGSTIHATAGPWLQAIVLGRVGGEEVNSASLPRDITETAMLFEIGNVKVACLRRGAWTGVTDVTSASASASNPTIQTRAFAATHPINSPLTLSIGGFDRTATPIIKGGYLCVGSSVGDIQIGQPPNSAAGYTSVADAANLARGGTVARYTPTTTNVASSGVLALTPVSGMLAIFAVLRNNSPTTTFQVYATVQALNGIISTPFQLIDTSTLLPRMVYLGTVNTLTTGGLQFAARASAASGTLDINSMIAVNLRDETVAVLAFDDVDLLNGSAGAHAISAQFNPTADQNPRVAAVGASAILSMVYRGPLPLMTTGVNVYALWFATNSNYWVFTNTSNAAVAVTLTATRYRSYLSPQ